MPTTRPSGFAHLFSELDGASGWSDVTSSYASDGGQSSVVIEDSPGATGGRRGQRDERKVPRGDKLQDSVGDGRPEVSTTAHGRSGTRKQPDTSTARTAPHTPLRFGAPPSLDCDNGTKRAGSRTEHRRRTTHEGHSTERRSDPVTQRLSAGDLGQRRTNQRGTSVRSNDQSATNGPTSRGSRRRVSFYEQPGNLGTQGGSSGFSRHPSTRPSTRSSASSRSSVVRHRDGSLSIRAPSGAEHRHVGFTAYFLT